MYNNPAFLLFLMATVRPYHVEWPTGEDRMLLVSLGTGLSANADATLSADRMGLLYNVGTIPDALIFGATIEQDLLCRVFGHCRSGAELDREVGAMRDADGVSAGIPKLFTYMRYNVDLSRDGLDRLGLHHITPAQVQQLDSVAHVAELHEVGRAAARQILAEHFAGFV
jgi:hypothetical protein